MTNERCAHEIGPWPSGQQWPKCLKCEIERLQHLWDLAQTNLDRLVGLEEANQRLQYVMAHLIAWCPKHESLTYDHWIREARKLVDVSKVEIGV